MSQRGREAVDVELDALDEEWEDTMADLAHILDGDEPPQGLHQGGWEPLDD